MLNFGTQVHKIVKLYKTGKPQQEEFLAGYGVGTYQEGKCIHVNDINHLMTKEEAGNIIDTLDKNSLSYYWPNLDEGTNIKEQQASTVLGQYKKTRGFRANIASISKDTVFVPPSRYNEINRYNEIKIRTIDTLPPNTLILTRVKEEV